MIQAKPNWSGPIDKHGDLESFLWDQCNSFEWPWNDPDASAKLRAELDPERIELLAVMFADAEICNGGFTQYFLNSSGELAEEALHGFRRFGMSEFAELFDAAYNALGQRPMPADRDVREKLLFSKFGVPRDLEELFQLAEPTMGPFDEKYFKLAAWDDARDGFLQAICRYIDLNRSVFFSMS